MSNNQKTRMNSFFYQNFETASVFSGSHKDNNSYLADLKNAHLFISGGTGFFGCWLLHLIQWLNEEKHLNIQATLLTRNVKAFQKNRPQFSESPYFHWLEGDVRNFIFPKSAFTHIIHAATEASAKLNLEDPFLMADTITEGTRRILEFARSNTASRVLFTSSGAIYGRQPYELTHTPESFMGGPDPLAPSSAYGEGKRFAEYLCAAYREVYKVDVVIARCFAFVGPYLPWNTHFAIGNFLRDAVESKRIQILGDGTPYRSYLYGADLSIWLLKLLTQGQPGRAYNVGSEDGRSLSQIATCVAEVAEPSGYGKISIEIAKKPDPQKPVERYVPSTKRAQVELGLKENFDLASSIQQSLLWHTSGQN